MKFQNRQLDIYQSGVDRSGARRVKGWKFGMEIPTCRTLSQNDSAKTLEMFEW